jgi:hypothetical protein
MRHICRSALARQYDIQPRHTQRVPERESLTERLRRAAPWLQLTPRQDRVLSIFVSFGATYFAVETLLTARRGAWALTAVYAAASVSLAASQIVLALLNRGSRSRRRGG